MSTVKEIVFDNFIADIDKESLTNIRLEPFASLENEHKLMVLSFINSAYKEAILTHVKNKEEIEIPTLAKIKIKRKNKISLKVAEKLAKDKNIDFNSLKNHEKSTFRASIKEEIWEEMNKDKEKRINVKKSLQFKVIKS